jgi:peptide deformylase
MQVVQAPDPRLRVKTKPVKKITPAVLQTIKDMVKLTKSFIDPEGVGLASTQVGLSEQYFVLKEKDGTFAAFFNPKILAYSKKTKKFFEGCLSIPNYWGEVERPIAVTVSYLTEKGEVIKKKLTGVDAWIFQHEFDHLQGRLYMDLVLEQKSRIYKVVGKDRTGADVFEEVPL